MRTSDFDYHLPERSIAQTAVEPRDSSRLLRVKGLVDHHFLELDGLLRNGDLLVVNRTKVRAARLKGTKSDTGGAVELLLIRRLDDARWEAMVRPARRIRRGTHLTFPQMTGRIETDPSSGLTEVSLHADAGDVEDLLPSAGEMPLPPYFHGSLRSPDRYQTIFAAHVGSAAAPTAALHFTPELAARIEARGLRFGFVDLEIGLDTFRPMQTRRVEDHVMHRERYSIPVATAREIALTRSHGGRVVAVGTTVVRTLETSAGPDGGVVAGTGSSDLFIIPGYRPTVVDALITNFHAPRTTLVAMIAAFIGPDWRSVYQHAIDEGYRLLSFGDAMLIEDIRDGSRDR